MKIRHIFEGINRPCKFISQHLKTHLLPAIPVLALIALSGCNDKDLVPTPDGPGVSLTVGLVNTAAVSRALPVTDLPFQEAGDPNENYIHKVHIIVMEAPLNTTDANAKVVRVITINGIENSQNETTTDGNWTPVAAQENDLVWYDNNGTAHSIYDSGSNLKNFRSWITSRVQITDDTDLAEHIEAIARLKGQNTWLYAIALCNIDLVDGNNVSTFVNADGTPVAIDTNLKVQDLRDLIYTGDLYQGAGENFPYDPQNTSTVFPWGPTGGPYQPIRFHDFAMSAINEVKFQPVFDANGRFSFDTYGHFMVQRLAARIDICFGVQAVNEYTDTKVLNGTTYNIINTADRTTLPYITDRGWFYAADTDPDDNATGPDNQRVAPFEKEIGAGFVGLVGDIPDPGAGYEARYLYDLDVTGTDNKTGYTDGVITDDWKFENQNYTGQFRFPVYDQTQWLNGHDVQITGAFFWMQSIRLTNCTNTGVYLIEQSKTSPTATATKYLGNEGTWQTNQNVYPQNYICSTPMARRSFTDRQLTSLSKNNTNRRPVDCIQSGLRLPAAQRTLYSKANTEYAYNSEGYNTWKNWYNRWGVYSTLGYVGDNTFTEYRADNKYTGIHLEGLINLNDNFVNEGAYDDRNDANHVDNKENNWRKRVAVDMKLVHNIGGGDANTRGEPMHFGVVRNTVYRVYVKFYAVGQELKVRMYWYNGSDNNFSEEYIDAGFYSYILEDDHFTQDHVIND